MPGIARVLPEFSRHILILAALIVPAALAEPLAAETAEKPNILVIFGDDIGLANVSAYSRGLMGYNTPNIDRIAKDGMIFTDYYAEQSCTGDDPPSSPAR